MYREAREHFSFLLFSLPPLARPRALSPSPPSFPLPGTEDHPQKHFRSPRPSISLSISRLPRPTPRLDSLSIPLLPGAARSRPDDGVDRPRRRPILHLNLVNLPELANELRVWRLILARSCSDRVYSGCTPVCAHLYIAVRVGCTTDTLHLIPLERAAAHYLRECARSPRYSRPHKCLLL